MRSTRSFGLSSLAAMAAIASAGLLAPVAQSGTVAQERSSSSAQQQGERGQQGPADSKSNRLRASTYRRITQARRGKRYAASVRQHQRHAAKARNRKRA